MASVTSCKRCGGRGTEYHTFIACFDCKGGRCLGCNADLTATPDIVCGPCKLENELRIERQKVRALVSACGSVTAKVPTVPMAALMETLGGGQ